MRCLALLLAVALLCCCSASIVPQKPTHWATDTLGVLSPETVSSLDNELENYQQQSQHHVLLWVGKLPAKSSARDFCFLMFNTWGIGRDQYDDGVVLFWFPESRELYIQVGYGLEQKIPDSEAVRIVREVIIPRIECEPDKAITLGVHAILDALEANKIGL